MVLRKKTCLGPLDTHIKRSLCSTMLNRATITTFASGNATRRARKISTLRKDRLTTNATRRRKDKSRAPGQARSANMGTHCGLLDRGAQARTISLALLRPSESERACSSVQKGWSLINVLRGQGRRDLRGTSGSTQLRQFVF